MLGQEQEELAGPDTLQTKGTAVKATPGIPRHGVPDTSLAKHHSPGQVGARDLPGLSVQPELERKGLVGQQPVYGSSLVLPLLPASAATS